MADRVLRVNKRLYDSWMSWFRTEPGWSVIIEPYTRGDTTYALIDAPNGTRALIRFEPYGSFGHVAAIGEDGEWVTER